MFSTGFWEVRESLARVPKAAVLERKDGAAMTGPMDKSKQETFLRLKEQYQSEPIKPRKVPEPEVLPEQLQKLRALGAACNAQKEYMSWEEIFVRQGKLVEDYEDDYTYDLPVLHYFPTYQSLRDRELRGYFGWRTRLRHHAAERTSLTYAYIYIYELINQIGVKSPEEGFQKLLEFQDEYGSLDSRILANMNTWLRDYVLYYQLDPKLLPDTHSGQMDQAYLTLVNWQQASDQELFQALGTFSTYRMDRSKLYKEDTDRYVRLMAGCCRKLQEYYLSHRKKSFQEEFLGVEDYEWISLFSSAVFFKRQDTRTYAVQLTPVCTYSNKEGIWTVQRLRYETAKHRKLGKLVKTIEGELRTLLGYQELLQPYHYKWLTKLVTGVFEDWQAEEDRKKRAQVNLDAAVLDKIRQEAAITRERLITEADLGEEEPEVPEEEPVLPLPGGAAAGEDLFASGQDVKPAPKAAQQLVQKSQASAQAQGLPWNLTEAELHYLKDILEGKPTGWVQEQGLMADLLVDGINAKALDVLGDNVLEGDPPELVEDYLADVRQAVEGAPKGVETSQQAAAGAAPWNLTADELEYLQDILEGKPTGWVRERGLMASVLFDGINDKLFEEFGDTVLAGDPPEVLEDYIEEVREGLAAVSPLERN